MIVPCETQSVLARSCTYLHTRGPQRDLNRACKHNDPQLPSASTGRTRMLRTGPAALLTVALCILYTPVPLMCTHTLTLQCQKNAP